LFDAQSNRLSSVCFWSIQPSIRKLQLQPRTKQRLLLAPSGSKERVEQQSGTESKEKKESPKEPWPHHGGKKKTEPHRITLR
jgi:hypothetical protein